MILTGYCRLGADAEVRETQDGTAVANLSLAFNYGRRDDNGERPTQWVRAALFGQRADSLAQYLVRGQGLDVVIEDVHVETFEARDGGTGHALVGRVVLLEFTGSPPQGQQQSQQQQQRPQGNGRPQGQGQQQRGQQQGQQRGQGNGNGRSQQQQGNNGRNAYRDAREGRANQRGNAYDRDNEPFE